MSSTNRFDWASTNNAHIKSQYHSSNLVHHPWRAHAKVKDSLEMRKIDRFLARSKRRKHPSQWGSDASTIYTESTGQSSQSSLSLTQSSSPNSSILRKTEEPLLPPLPRGRAATIAIPPPISNPPPAAQYDPNLDPRGTINDPSDPSKETSKSRHQHYFSADFTSFQSDFRPPPPPPRVERGVFQCHDDLQAPRPPRSPCISPVVSTHKVAAATLPKPSNSNTLTERPSVDNPGPIDVDTLEAYLEDASVDSLAMMEIEEQGEDSRFLAIPPRPGLLSTRQATCDTLVYSVCTDEDEDDKDETYPGGEAGDANQDPLKPLMRLEKMDLLAESDDDEDYDCVHSYLKRFPVLDEREAERILCGYCRGFEPTVDDEGQEDGEPDEPRAFEI